MKWGQTRLFQNFVRRWQPLLQRLPVRVHHQFLLRLFPVRFHGILRGAAIKAREFHSTHSQHPSAHLAGESGICRRGTFHQQRRFHRADGKAGGCPDAMSCSPHSGHGYGPSYSPDRARSSALAQPAMRALRFAGVMAGLKRFSACHCEAISFGLFHSPTPRPAR